MNISIAVSASSPLLLANAQHLADELHLKFISDIDASYEYLLIWTPNYLGLLNTKEKKANPFYIDFLSNRMLMRSQQAGLRKELVARAMGIKPKENPLIIDATAGLGRDSFILAALGYHIIMLERSPVLYALLRDALSRAKQNHHAAPIIERLRLIHSDAIEWIKDKRADIVYLDPMFPERRKSASVKKEMQILQDLIGKDLDTGLLFQAALTCAKKRIVVKRPRLAANIIECTPSFSVTGTSNRFDIYLAEGPWNS